VDFLYCRFRVYFLVLGEPAEPAPEGGEVCKDGEDAGACSTALLAVDSGNQHGQGDNHTSIAEERSICEDQAEGRLEFCYEDASL
jgi:hypothetical protein